MFKRFFGCYFWVRFFLIIIIWICSFGKDNCFYQCVSIVGNQFTFLSYPYKLPMLVFFNPWFSSQSLNKTTLLFFALFAQLPLFLFSRLQAWKLGFQSHIKIITRFLWSLFMVVSPLIYSWLYNWQDPLICTHLAIFDWLYSFASWVIEFVMHWWLDLYVLWSIHLTHWFHKNAFVLWQDPWYKSFHTTHSSYKLNPWCDFDLLLWFWNYNFFSCECLIHLPLISLVDWMA